MKKQPADTLGEASATRFIADENVGKLGRYLRRLGFDTVFFGGGEDRDMVRQALSEGRIILTRDTHIEKYGAAVKGRVRVVTLSTDSPEEQLKQVIEVLGIGGSLRPLTLCLECNCPLVKSAPEDVAGRVPPYVLKTQKHYMACPSCGRVYWRGTHWQAMRQHFKTLGD